MTRIFPVDDPSRVSEVRRSAKEIATQEGLTEELASNAALVATEACTNILKHAHGGEVLISSLSDRAAPGVEILAIDRGPGISDLERCLSDGYSTVSTSGTGLGAMTRLSQVFDIYSEAGKGTVLVAQIQDAAPDSRMGLSMQIGAVLRPVSGEDVSGDSWAISERNGTILLIVADGLGHGLLAARASAEAISCFKRSAEISPVPLIERVHTALRGTRGAAVAVANIDVKRQAVKYAGIGNIGGVIAGSGNPRFMVSHNGTAGHQAARIQEFSYVLPEGAIVIMHSDGLNTSWNLDRYVGLRRRHPSIIAGILYRDAARRRDDICVVVAKRGGA